MNAESKRIAVACFIGATVGALLALEIHRYFWWVGVLLGGMVGYCAYRAESLVRTVRKVWSNMFTSDKTEMWASFKTNVTGMAELSVCLSGLVIIALGVFACVMSVVFWSVAAFSLNTAISMKNADSYRFWVGGTVCAVFSAFSLYLTEGDERKANRSFACLLLSPGVLPFTACAVVLLAGCSAIYVAIRLPRFFKSMFILVHSEFRLLCMTDSMIGALAGYFLGSALLGGVIGAAIGVLNYELVSVLWLKLAPKR